MPSFTKNACFLDTNILVYAAAGATSDPVKWKIAHEIMAEDGAAISAQVLQEFYVAATRPGPGRLEQPEVLKWMENLSVFPMVHIDASLVLEGVATATRYRISYWDGAIVAAAVRAEASTLFSEDLAHGQLYGDVRVINPFIER